MPFTAFTSGHWAAFVIMMGFIGFFNVVSVSAIQAFVGFRFADRRGELFNVIYVANNIGVALGTGLSGVLADLSYQLSFVMNGVTSAVFAGFFWSYLSKVKNYRFGCFFVIPGCISLLVGTPSFYGSAIQSGIREYLRLLSSRTCPSRCMGSCGR